MERLGGGASAEPIVRNKPNLAKPTGASGP
jgi:hypothetical protein